MPGQTETDVLDRRREVWQSRPLTREVYRRYYEIIAAELCPGTRTVEIGAGAAQFKQFMPTVLLSDIVPTSDLDFAADAMQLPIRTAALDNIVMLDVLHHLPRPAMFFREAIRVLRPGGRLVMLEPHVSSFSRLVFRVAHPERVDLRVDPLPEDHRPVFQSTSPFSSNQAIPTLLFFHHLPRFLQRFHELRLLTRRLDSVIAYPLSGGFSGPCLVPRFAHRLVWAAERLLLPLRRWMAFRLLVTLERT